MLCKLPLAGVLLPERGGSPNADKIASLYTVTLVIAAVVFAGVVIAIVYALRTYSERNHPVATQTRGNTRLEVAWTVAAAGLIVFLAVLTLIELPGIENADPSEASAAVVDAGIVPAGKDKPLTIEVVGRRYIWKFRYPGGASSYEEMVAPVGVTVKLEITSIDVAHSWWIPKLGGKFDAIPGYTNETWFRISKEGVYEGQCAELCGRNHASMFARVRAVSPDEYVAWLAKQKRENAEGRAAAKAARPTIDR